MSEKPGTDILTFERDDSDDIIDILRSGVSEIEENDEATKIVIYVADDDSDEVKDAKKNIQFTVDTARDAISFLLKLGKSTGNPRFFETVTSLINAMNNSTNQLLNIDSRKRAKKNEQESGETQEKKVINQQFNTDQVTVVMSTSEALSLIKKPEARTING